MENLSLQQQNELNAIFGTRVNYDYRERMLYMGDVGTMPKIVSKIAGKRMPAAIVQPVSLEEIVTLTRWATANSIPLIPRGKATSGYGGVIPMETGVVVEFNRMKGISVDAENLTVTVQPGAVWIKVEEVLNQAGLTLKSYPTSAPSSTVGGWLATGGAGIGSYAAGYFENIVTETMMVTPSGEAIRLTGQDLAVVSGASGTTGFITSVTFMVEPLKARIKKAYAFNSRQDAAAFIQGIYTRKIPLWSVSFTNPEAIHYKNLMPAKGSNSKENEQHTVIPENYILLTVYEASSNTEQELESLVKITNATILAPSIAEHEWDERYSPMKAKRLG
ncbi:MAG TPA: FAD-binding oxidoreductase, partial [Syntrophomonadaceae bacterium]|nr:FAD-binding oxidoreductase [Syntrophomonadaceae bacterium]